MLSIFYNYYLWNFKEIILLLLIFKLIWNIHFILFFYNIILIHYTLIKISILFYLLLL